MFKVKSKHSLPICIYQFLLWHLSYISQKDGCRTGDGPSGSQEKARLCLHWCWPQAQGEAAASANAVLAGEGTAVVPNGAPVQSRTDWIPCPQFGSQAHFHNWWNASVILPSCMWLCAYERQWGTQRQDAAGTPMEAQLGAAWFTPLIHDMITCGAPELQEMILCRECCFGMWENWVSLATQLLWFTLENTPYFPNSESRLASQATVKLKSHS